MAINKSKIIEQRAADRKAAASLIVVNVAKEAIIDSVLPLARLNRIQFDATTLKQQVFLIKKYLGAVKSAEYEAEVISENGLVAAVSQGTFTRTFLNINEATVIFDSITEKLSKKLPGIYNSTTASFILLELYRSLMKHITQSVVADHVLSTISIPSTAINLKVSTIDNYELSISIAEIKLLLDYNASSIIGTSTTSTTILTESIALALLGINEDVIAASLITNFDNQPTYSTIGTNIIDTNNWSVDSRWVKNNAGFVVNTDTSSDVRLYVDDNSLLDVSSNYLVEMKVSNYIEGSLMIFFGGDVAYNAVTSNGNLSFNIAPGTSTHSSLVLKSSDLKATIDNISIRKIII